jgi:hypothetical protein
MIPIRNSQDALEALLSVAAFLSRPCESPNANSTAGTTKPTTLTQRVLTTLQQSSAPLSPRLILERWERGGFRSANRSRLLGTTNSILIEQMKTGKVVRTGRGMYCLATR